MPPNNDRTPYAEVRRAANQGATPRSGFRNMRALGLIAVTVVLYILLLDAAVETFISGSPVRWWVALTVVTYLVVCAVVWRRDHPLWSRLESKTIANISFFVLLGLLTLTVWLPGGLTSGVRLVGQSTSTILIITSVMAVAISGMLLTRPCSPYPAVKWAIDALAVYAMIAFLWAVPTETGFAGLFQGESFWRWLPRWFQGGFIGAFILVPAAILYQVASGLLRTPGTDFPKRGRQVLALSMSLIISLAGLQASGGTLQGPVMKISDRGPGLRPQPLDSLVLPALRSLDLTHVDPAFFAVALGKDPTKIFEFVRDQIAYEAYTGILRGPRGTLLAMAGNSADRALLLASLLTHSGYQVRFVQGTLSERDAMELVGSMWASIRKLPKQNTATREGTLAAVRAFVKSGKRDFAQIRDALKGVMVPGGKVAPSLDSLIQETRAHYWVQLAKGSGWTDLDPSFADSTMGRSYARSDETLPALPTNLYHRVTMRIMAEESDGTRSRTDELGRYSVNAADLSAVNILFIHVPENWRGPVRSIEGALSSALSETGRIKPVLLVVGQQPIIGTPFPVEVITTGAGGIQGLLSGAGTRNPVEIATAEWIEFKFDYPDGRSETVMREVFDLVGKAKRDRGESLKQDEIRVLAGGDRTKVLTTTVLSILFTTGRLDASHLAGLTTMSSSQSPEIRGSAVLLRRLGIAFTIISDALLEKVKTSDGTVVKFYPDSPRVLIAEFSARAKRLRVAVDLRRDHARAAAIGPGVRSVFAATVMRGVVDGTLERMLVDYVAARVPGTIDLKAGVSTSLLFEQAAAARVPPILVTSDQKRLDATIPDDARARLFDDVRQGNYALAPQRPIRVADVLRYAWWRINPQTGETIAVTDDGLHQTSTESVVVTINANGTYSAWLVTDTGETLLAQMMTQGEMEELVFRALVEGFEVLGPL